MNIIITGAGKGIGFETVKAFSKDSNNNIIAISRNIDHLKNIEISGENTFLFPISYDLSDINFDLKEKISSQIDKIDILINNAVTHATQPFLELSFDDWHQTLSVTLDGSFHCTQAVVPIMAASGGGSIINMGGMFGHMPVPNRSPSSAAKAGLAGLTRALALEFAKYNINVNYLAPGPANTQRDPSKPFQFDLSKIPFGRFTEASEVVNMVMLLSGKEGRFITGQSIHVNGGVFMNN